MTQEKHSKKEVSPKMMTEKEAMDRVSKLAKFSKQDQEASSPKEPIRQTIKTEAVFKMFQK